MQDKFKEILENDLRAAIKKSEDMTMADLRGKRISRRYTEVMQEKLNEISQIKDSQVLLSTTVSLLRDSGSILDDIIMEANVSRREQQGRVSALKECYSKILELEKEQEIQEKAQKENLEEEQTKVQQVRKIGQRPEKLRDVRNNEPRSSENEPSFLPRQ